VGVWGRGPTPQTPIPNPQSPIPILSTIIFLIFLNYIIIKKKFYLNLFKPKVKK